MENVQEKMMVTASDVERMGFKRNQAIMIIRQAKQVLVNQGFAIYNNKRLGVVPKNIVMNLIGISEKGDE